MKSLSLFCVVLLFNVNVVVNSAEDPDLETLDDFFDAVQSLGPAQSSSKDSADTDPADLELSDLDSGSFITCDECFLNIPSNRYKAHMVLHKNSSSETHHCQADLKCTFSFSSKKALANHHHTVHQTQGPKLKCQTCGEWLSYSAYYKNLSEHRKHPRVAVRGKSQRCTKCNYKFGARMLKHLKTHGAVNLSCDWIGCTFKSDSHQTMCKHREEAHSTPATHYCTCVRCKGEFIPRATYRRHKIKKSS